MQAAKTPVVTRKIEDEKAHEIARMNTNGVIALIMAVAALVLGIIAKSI